MSKEEKLETIWDYNPTEEEIEKLFGKSIEETKEELEFVYTVLDWRRYSDISALLELRGKCELALVYREMVLEDPKYIAISKDQEKRHHFNRISK